MKKLKSKSKLPPLETKLAEVKPVDPYFESLELEKRKTRRRPTVFELTQIASVLVANKRWKDYWHESDGPIENYSVAEAAIGLWDHCGKVIADQIDQEVYYQKLELESPPDPPDWVVASMNETFPIPFEKALAIIIGKKTRRTDRYKIFREFLLFVWLQSKKNTANIDRVAEEKHAMGRFNHYNSAGFTQEAFHYLAGRYDSWKAAQAKEKAKKAAKARWEKKS